MFCLYEAAAGCLQDETLAHFTALIFPDAHALGHLVLGELIVAAVLQVRQLKPPIILPRSMGPALQGQACRNACICFAAAVPCSSQDIVAKGSWMVSSKIMRLALEPCTRPKFHISRQKLAARDAQMPSPLTQGSHLPVAVA